MATGLASRGLNFPDVGHVINYDVPLSLSGYVHQVGRTGRGGRPGLATTLFTTRDRPQAAAWLVDCLRSAPGGQVPAWLQRLAAEAAMKAAATEEGALEAAATAAGGSGGRRGDGITVRPRGTGRGALPGTGAAGTRGRARQVFELSGDVLAGGPEGDAGEAAAQLGAVTEQELGRSTGGDGGAAAEARFGVFLPPRPGRRQGPAVALHGGAGGRGLAVDEAGPVATAAAAGDLAGSVTASAYAAPGSGGSGGAVVDRRHDAEAWQVGARVLGRRNYITEYCTSMGASCFGLFICQCH